MTLKWIITIGLLAISLSACRESARTRLPVQKLESPLEHSLDSDSVDVHAEFLAIADGLENGENQYLGRQQIPRIERQLQQGDLSFEETVNLRLRLCWHQLRLGQIDAAAKTINAAFAKVNEAGGRIHPSMYRLRALVHLRDAEVKNCVQRHNRDCCLLPLRGGGVHREPGPAERAKADLLTLLAATPTDLEAGWLLNIAGMATGGYPQALPEQFRIPPTIFQSTPCSRIFVDVASQLGVDALNLCGGSIVEDFDQDGLLDIVTSSYDPREPLRYYRNQGDGSFEDRSHAVGLDVQLGGLSCLSADYDNDGDADILVLRGAWLMDDGCLRNSLLRNDGDVFRDVTREAGLAVPAYPTQTAAWADFDNDGHLDLYIGNESRLELPEEGGDFPSQLFSQPGRRHLCGCRSQCRCHQTTATARASRWAISIMMAGWTSMFLIAAQIAFTATTAT